MPPGQSQCGLPGDYDRHTLKVLLVSDMRGELDLSLTIRHSWADWFPRFAPSWWRLFPPSKEQVNSILETLVEYTDLINPKEEGGPMMVRGGDTQCTLENPLNRGAAEVCKEQI